MAKKSATPEGSSESVLVTAAKEIGAAAGKVAALVGVKGDPPAPEQKNAPKNVVVPKLAPKNKARLPRKLKKARQKAEAKS